LRDTIADSGVAQRLIDTAPTVLAFLPNAFDEAADLFDRFDEDDESLPGATPTP
jgi:hypothetical protein